MQSVSKTSNKTSITTALIFYLALLIAFVSGLASLLNYTYYSSRQVRDFEAQYQEDTKYLADLLAVPLWNYEEKAVESLCQAFLKTEGTLAVTLEGPSQQLNYGADPAVLNTATSLSQELYYEGTYLGKLVVYYSTAEILARVRHSQVNFLLNIFLVIVLTAIAITLIVKRVITRPFALLQQNLLAISTGDFTPLKKDFKHRETQNIADAFNYMCHELLQREDEISQKGTYLQNIINAMPSPLLILDRDLVITQFNDATKTFFTQLGLSFEKNLSLGDVSLLENYREQIVRALDSGQVIQLNKESLSSLNGEIYVNIVIFPIQEHQVQNVAVRIDDITIAENQRTALLQAQKMELVGTLAGGLAHDFNNVLGIISGSVSMLELKADKNNLDSDDMNRLVARIKNANERAVQMIQQLLMLGKQHHMDKKYIDLERIVDSCLELGAASFDKSIKIDFRHEGQGKTCFGDAAKLEQVFLNLLINAAHAMTQMRKNGEAWGGTLSIAIDRVVADEFFRRRFPEAQGASYWRVSISDTGVGISHKVFDRIFDPFFSTKESDKGTGLGLAMVKNIVGSHDGFVRVYSEPGAGTTFTVYLPAAVQAVDQDQPVEKEELRQLVGCLLLVDDEQEIRATTGEMLAYLGIEVLKAENGALAVETYRQHQAEIDLVLMDLVMPFKSGRDAAAEILALNPQAKIIMSSGFRKDFRIREALELGACDFLHKPYSLSLLYRMLAKYLPVANSK